MRRPWFPFYGDDFQGSGKVKVMSNAERGCYVTLLWYQWGEGYVPSELEELANICGESVTTMRRYWKRLERCFPVGDDGKRRNARQEIERQKADAMSAKQSAKAKLRQSPGKPGAGVRLASGTPSGCDSAAPAVSSTQVTDHNPQTATTSVLRTEAPPRDDQPTWDNREAAQHIRTICYAPDGREPEGCTIGEDLRFWKRCLAAGQSPARIVSALHGLPEVMRVGGKKWSPARIFGKRGDWVNLFERAVTADGKSHRPALLGDIIQQVATPPVRAS